MKNTNRREDVLKALSNPPMVLWESMDWFVFFWRPAFLKMFLIVFGTVTFFRKLVYVHLSGGDLSMPVNTILFGIRDLPYLPGARLGFYAQLIFVLVALTLLVVGYRKVRGADVDHPEYPVSYLMALWFGIVMLYGWGWT